MARHREAIVYRIEDADADGPFKEGHIREALVEAYGGGAKADRLDPYEMPGPIRYDEGAVHDHYRRGLTKDHRFAFASKAQMRRWFKPALLRRLASKGYRLGVYRVERHPDKLAVSDNQALFRRSFARLERIETLK